MAHIVIIVPGIMGSVLELDGEIIWPGPVTSLMLPYSKMKELLREDLIPTDCIRSFFITKQYQQLIDDLNMCGFIEDNGTLVIAAYDWRKNNVVSAQTLATHISNIVAIHGEDSEISIIAHSMGGLVSRYYLESGVYDNSSGFRNIRCLVTLATPHRGASVALPVVLGYEKRLFLNKDQVLQLASDTRYPSAYQLLPPQDEPFAWDGVSGKQFGQLDIYNDELVNKLGLVKSNLAAATEFHRGINHKRRPSHVRYFCFSGTRETTATHILIRQLSTKRLEPVKVEQEDSGDGTVPTWSSFLDGQQRFFVGGEHGTIYHNTELRRILAIVLGKEGVLKGVPVTVSVSLRDKVVEPQDVVHVSVAFAGGISNFSGILTIQRAHVQEDGNVVGFDNPIKLYPVEYKGLGMEAVSLRFDAPDIRGVYRVAFCDDVASAPSGFDELIVQEPLRTTIP